MSSRPNRSLRNLTFFFCVLSIPMLAQTTYTITSFQAANSGLPGAITIVGNINSSGLVAGTLQSGSKSIGYLRGPNGGFNYFNVQGADPYSTKAYGINARGTVVGSCTISGKTTGFIRTLSGAETLYTVPSGAPTTLTGINLAGYLTGNYVDGAAVGFITAPDGTFTTFQYSTFSGTYPNVISDTNEIVGNVSTSGHGSEAGFIRMPDGEEAPLSLGGIGGSVSGLNDTGQVAGFYETLESDQSFLYANGTTTPFSVPGAYRTYLKGINNNGALTGEYQDSAGNPYGFIATPVN